MKRVSFKKISSRRISGDLPANESMLDAIFLYEGQTHGKIRWQTVHAYKPYKNEKWHYDILHCDVEISCVPR